MHFTKRNITSILSLLIILLLALHSEAQNKARLGIGFADIGFVYKGQSPYLGYETNTLIHDLPLPSFQLGVSRDFELSKRFYLNSGMLISLQGVNYNTKYIYDDIKYQLHIWYLKVPLILRYNSSLKKNKLSGFYAGPYLASKLKATLTKKVWGIQEKEKQNNVNNFDFGTIAGYSWDTGFLSDKVMLDFSVSYSLINSMNTVEGNIRGYPHPAKEYARNINMIIALEYKL